jgi:hypothetical protein
MVLNLADSQYLVIRDIIEDLRECVRVIDCDAVSIYYARNFLLRTFIALIFRRI